jgi:hypothetical protein
MGGRHQRRPWHRPPPADLAGSLNGPLRQASYEEVSAKNLLLLYLFAKSCVVSIQKLASYMCLNWKNCNQLFPFSKNEVM